MNTQTICNRNTAVAAKPIIWIAPTNTKSDNYLESLRFDDEKKHLSKLFEVLEADNINIDGYQDYGSEQHIILIDNNTPHAEKLVKRISWKVKNEAKNNPEILVLKTHYPASTYGAKELIDLIHGNEDKNADSLAMTFKDYCKQCNLEEIEPDDIDNHLINIIKYCPILNISDECEIVRIRTYLKFKPKEFQQKYMSLELKFKKELQKRGVVYDSSDSIDSEKEELKAILNEKDKFKKVKQSKEFKKKYQYTSAEFKELIDYVLSEISSTKCRVLNPDEFHSLEIPENKWIYDGILPSVGVTVFSALSGVGKTISSFDIAASVIYNQPFLDIPSNIENRKTLFVNSVGEMSDVEMLEAFIKRGIGNNTDIYKVILDWDFTQWEILEDIVRENRPQLMIMDSLRGVTDILNIDENSKDAGRPVRKLQELCNKYQLACILIHHDRKSDGSTNKVSKSAGNISITASASCVWNLSKNRDDTLTFEITKIRNSKNKKLVIKFNEEDNSFILVDCVENAEATTKINPTTLDSIIDFFEKNDNKPQTIKEIAEKLNLNKDTVRKTLNRHESIKFIKSVGSKGSKCSPAIYNLKNYCPTVPSNAEPIDIQEIEDIGHSMGHLNNDCPTVPPTIQENITTTIEDSVPPSVPPSESIDTQGIEDLIGQQDSNVQDFQDVKEHRDTSNQNVNNKNTQANTPDPWSDDVEPIDNETVDDIYKGLNDDEILIIEAVEDNPDILVNELRIKLNISPKKLEKIVQGLIDKNIFEEYLPDRSIEFTPEFKLKLEETPRKQ